MDSSVEYAQSIQKIRLKLAMEKNDWYVLFKKREKYINWMILSFLIDWLVFASVLIFFDYDFLYFVVIPNFFWLFFVAPFFCYKLYYLTNVINTRKEEIVLTVWQRTKSIEQIMLQTGLEENFILYYLQKNGLECDSV